MDDTGLITVDCGQDVSAVANRFIAAAKQAGLTIFGQRDSTKAPDGPHRPRPAILILFGNPNVIARLIDQKPEIGIDLPMKTLVWQGADGKVRISYNDPRWLFRRHGLGGQFGDTADKMAALLGKLVRTSCSAVTQH